MADPISTQQRPVRTTGEDSLFAENRMGCLEAASPNLLTTDWCKKRDKCEWQSNSTPALELEDGLHAKAVAAEEGGGEEKKVAATCQEKGASGAAESFDDRDLPIPARQRAILTRVLSHWKRTTRRGSQTSTPSETGLVMPMSSHDFQLGPWLAIPLCYLSCHCGAVHHYARGAFETH